MAAVYTPDAMKSGDAIGRLTRALLPPPLAAHVVGMGNRLAGERELRLCRLLCSGAGRSVDVGAHFGAWTYSMMHYSKTCEAFEPNPVCVRFLQRAYPSLSVHPVALSDRTGVANLEVPLRNGIAQEAEGRLGQHSYLSDQLGKIIYSVETRTLDSYDFSDISLIKIDTEGHELSVIAGALTTLKRCTPRIVVECEERHRVAALATVMEVLVPLRYHAFARTERRNYKMFATATQGYGLSTSSNFLFLPSTDSLLQMCRIFS